MITLKSDTEINQILDKLSHKFLVDQMLKDCPVFAKTINPKENEWIGRVLFLAGSNHEGSVIPFGFLLRYQFKKIALGYDMGIREIKIPESMDEFLDLMNDVKKNPEMFNLNYKGK